MNNQLAKNFNLFSLLKFTAPTIIMMVFMSLYTMVDGIFVSNIVGSDALSAINIVYPYVSIFVAIAIMLATGGSSIIARKMGEGKGEEAKTNFTFIVIAAIVLGVIFSLVGIIFADPIIRALGATERLYDYCYSYQIILSCGAVLSVLQMLFQFFFVTAGKPNLGLFSTVLGGAANIFFDYLFINVMGMGIAGAGYGTVIGYSIPALWGLFYFAFCRKGTLYFVKPKFDGKLLIKSCLNGSSEMVTNLAISVTTFLFNIVMLKYIGEDGVAAITVVLYSQFLLTSVFLGFSSGVAPVFSYNYGRGNELKLKKVFKICMIFVGVVSLLTFALAFILSGGIVSIFIRDNNEVFELTKNGFLLFAISYIFTGINIFSSSMFTAFSNGGVSAFISFMRTFLLLSASIVFLPMIIGTTGVWLAVPLAELITFIISLILILKYGKTYKYI